ncbi:Dipeptide transport system permease protein DppB [Labilithrix luteola]|uniref:Dipeptide transport system permease protein DppB n=2 Tax=Labilithrix luteola TaxID=1391654 RepID=A0A0K1Q5L6_9BACT|nr:Dipeptide transport system permease protein DppB [Labilithrix luteola]
MMLGKALDAAIVVFALASAVFLALRVLPGDPSALILGDQASPLERAALRAKLHLDEPMWLQYARFLKGLVTFDLGESVRRPGASAIGRVLDAATPTAELAGLAVLMGAALGIGAAVLGQGPWLGRRRVWVDRSATALASTPLLAFAPIVTYALAARLRIVPLPGDPEAGFAGLLFASGLLSIPLAAHVARVSRAALDDVARGQFLGVARAKGGSYARMLWLHALPAAIGPIVTVIGAQLGALLGGAVVLERLFERRGLGTLILEAYGARDFPVLEAAVIFTGALFAIVQQLAASAHAAVDPRVGS